MLKTMMMLVGLLVCLTACGEGDSTAAEPPPPLECGDMLTCASGEYCRETSGGAAPTFSYDCQALPEDCQSCECLPDKDFCEESPAGLKVSIPLP